MRMLKDAIKVAWVARSPKVVLIFAINVLSSKLGSGFRIRRFSVIRVPLYGSTFFVNSWDALLAVRPGNEPHVQAAVRDVVKQSADGVFVDVGAHIGRYCFEFAGSFSKTIAFEPTSATYEYLHAAWQVHPHRDRIVLHKAGVSDGIGEAEFLISANESQNSVVRDPTASYLGRETVILKTLDQELSQDEKARLALLLIDVEGAEDKVLRGAEETLKAGSPTIIIELLEQSARQRCHEILTGLGYGGVQLDRTNWKYARQAG